MVQYSADGNTAFYRGYKFRRDPKSGYFLCTKKTDAGRRERLHVFVWRLANGEIPEGFHVHHIDGDKRNNELENLACIPAFDHLSHHGKEYAAEHREELIRNMMEKAQPEAKKWHASDEGREWHSRHAKEVAANARQEKYTCQCCGKVYFAYTNGPEHRFCSNACKTKARYESGADNETRKCEMCGAEFTVNKYSRTRCCSRRCAAVLRCSRGG